MRKTASRSAMAAAMLCAVIMSSCQKYSGLEGQPIRFSVSSGTETKASYSGVTSSGKERIDWESGDLIRVYCAKSPEQQTADYVVNSSGITADGAKSKATASVSGGTGLTWGEGEHVFYAVYPSPASTGKSADVLSGGSVKGNIPSSQAPLSVTSSGDAYTAKADLLNQYMVSRATATPSGDENVEVTLPFTPITTAIEFTIENGFTSDDALKISSVTLTSATKNLSGTFTADISASGWTSGYPTCTEAGSDGTKSVSVDFSSTDMKATGLAKGKTLTFTLFLAPTDDVNDLTFKLTKADGSWVSTKLAYSNDATHGNDGLSFARCKKHYVRGLLVPEGAQWTVKYDPTVQPWNTETGHDIDPMPETDGDPFVTSWDTGIDDELTLTDNGHEYVEIGGLKWATCNLGANTPKDYGWYFSWAGTTGYVRDGSKWVTAQGGFELSGGFCWAKAPYNTAGVQTSWNKYIPTGKGTYWSGGGSPDNKLSLELDDDAVRANLGGSWRMPTQADFQKLYEACGGTGDSCAPTELPSANPGKGIYWVTADQTDISDYAGVAGLLFCDGTSKLFFVAAGYGEGDNFNDEGHSGRYWSGSVFSNPPCNAYYMAFVSNKVKPDDANARNQGYPVRPVSDL